MSYDKNNRELLNSISKNTKFLYTPQMIWYSLDKEPHDYMLGKMLWVLYTDGSYGLRAVGRSYYDDGHFDWTWVEDTCYDKDSDHQEWDSVAFWAFPPKVQETI